MLKYEMSIFTSTVKVVIHNWYLSVYFNIHHWLGIISWISATKKVLCKFQEILNMLRFRANYLILMTFMLKSRDTINIIYWGFTKLTVVMSVSFGIIRKGLNKYLNKVVEHSASNAIKIPVFFDCKRQQLIN